MIRSVCLNEKYMYMYRYYFKIVGVSYKNSESATFPGCASLSVESVCSCWAASGRLLVRKRCVPLYPDTVQ